MYVCDVAGLEFDVVKKLGIYFSVNHVILCYIDK